MITYPHYVLRNHYGSYLKDDQMITSKPELAMRHSAKPMPRDYHRSTLKPVLRVLATVEPTPVPSLPRAMLRQFENVKRAD